MELNCISSPKIDALLVQVLRELDDSTPMEAVILASGVMGRLAEYLHDLGEISVIEATSSPE